MTDAPDLSKRPDAPAAEETVSVRIGASAPAAPVTPRRTIAGLLAVAVLGAALAVLFAQRAGDVRAEPVAPASSTGAAVTPASPEVTELTRAMTAAMATLWSYDYRSLDALPTQVAAIATPSFQESYAAVFERIQELAPQTRAVVAASVQHLGVIAMSGDTAELLVYLDQAASKAGGRPVGAGARLRVEAVRVDGVWKVDAVTPF